ncbi:MAG: S8 family peptidase [Ignavibacteriales bacterium]|nr:S8 family peptidase [Ignavibacteriales bacterium]
MKFLIFSWLIISSIIHAQEKYLIFFKDKGITKESFLAKSADRENLAIKYLSKRSIERRKKVLGDKFFTYEDLPINQFFIDRINSYGIKIVNKLKWFNAVSAYLNESEINELKKENFIEKIVKVKKVKHSNPIAGNVPFKKLPLPTNINNTYNYGPSITQNELSDIPAVHNMGFSGEGVIIGLLDSGYDWERHNSLKERDVIAEYDFIYNDSETSNDSKDAVSTQHNHGTSVFSILAGFDEGKIIGPAFNASFILAKTEYIPTETHVEELNYAEALEWMDSIGVDITTSSLGYSEFDEGEGSYTYEDMDGNSTIVTRAAEMAFERGIIVITSAGNEGNQPWKYITAPGDGFNTLTIGAVNASNNLASYSSRGPTFDGRIKPEIVAMGSSVFNAVAGTDTLYGYGSGTSFSSPMAAGIAGLLLSAYPHLTNKQVRSIMMESGDNVSNPNNDIGYGLVSALKAVTFPNISVQNSNYKINKMFPDTVFMKTDSIHFLFTKENSDLIEIAAVRKDENRKLQFEIPFADTGNIIRFSFELFDSHGNLIYKEPLEGNYRWEYGSELISFKVENPIHKPVIPAKFTLSQNYPNPFNSITKINYSIPEELGTAKVRIDLYDILGRKVKTVINKEMNSGNHFVSFSSEGLSSGVYFYRFQSNDFMQTKKMIILK